MATAVKTSGKQQFDIPGPPPSPVLGVLPNMMRFGRNPVMCTDFLYRTYGPVAALSAGGGTRIVSPFRDCPGTVFVFDAELNRQVITKCEIYYKSALSGSQPENPAEQRRRYILWNWGSGLFHVNSDAHKQHRRLLMPAFHKKTIETYRDTIVAITEEEIGKWQIGETRNVSLDLRHIALRIAGCTLFGQDEGDEGFVIGDMLGTAIHLMTHPLVRYLPYDLPGLPYHRLLNISEQNNRIARKLIAEKRAEGLQGTDILTMLLKTEDEDGTGLTDDEVVGHMGTIFAAGHETTTNALSWTLFLLSQHPQILSDLVDELDGVLGGAAPTVEQLNDLPLLDRVLKESLRILPPVPMNHRLAVGEQEIGGYHIPDGTEIMVSIYHLHRDPDLFPEPDRFKPDRWLTANPNTFEYNPFSAGPRMCIGAPFAIMEAKLALAIILQRFRLQPIPNMEMDQMWLITMGPRQGFNAIIQPQDGKFDVGVGAVRGNIHDMVAL